MRLVGNKVDKVRRRFLIMLASTLGGVGAFFASIPFFSSLWPSAKVKALGEPLEVDISHLNPGDIMTVAWRGSPIWIVRRTPAMLMHLTDHNFLLRDPNSRVDQQPTYAQNIYRSIKPEFLVLVGVCTHLGCIPLYKPNEDQLGSRWPGGFYCPCHGSRFDLSGRVFKNVPAPINLLVPHYRYLNENIIVIGEDPTHA